MRIGLWIWGALALAGCAGQETPQSRQLLLSAYGAYDKGDHAAVVRLTDQLLREDGRNLRADEARYLRGLAGYRLGDRARAVQDIQDVIATTKMPELRGKALLVRGDLAMEADEWALARDAYSQALCELGETRPPADRAMYRLGVALQMLGQWPQADEILDRLVYRFGENPWAAQAGLRTHGRAWTIRAGLYGDRRAAQDMVDRLQAGNWDARVEPMILKGELTHAVNVGRYGEHSAAHADLLKVLAISPGATVAVVR